MIDIGLNNDADFNFDSDLVEVEGVEEVKQAVGIILRTRLGEFFADANSGVDREYLIGKDFNKQYAAAAIRDAIQQDARVTSISTVDLTVDGRNLLAKVEFTIDETKSATVEVAMIA